MPADSSPCADRLAQPNPEELCITPRAEEPHDAGNGYPIGRTVLHP
jgi:hypothetical protein